MTLVFDTYAWVEFFLGTKEGEKVKRFLDKEEEIVTPSIVLAEIANKYFREGIDKKTILSRIDAIEEISVVRYIDDEVIEKMNDARKILVNNAKKLKLKRKPSLADIIVYATTLSEEGKLVTGDNHFKGLENIIFLKEISE